MPETVFNVRGELRPDNGVCEVRVSVTPPIPAGIRNKVADRALAFVKDLGNTSSNVGVAQATKGNTTTVTFSRVHEACEFASSRVLDHQTDMRKVGEAAVAEGLKAAGGLKVNRATS